MNKIKTENPDQIDFISKGRHHELGIKQQCREMSVVPERHPGAQYPAYKF